MQLLIRGTDDATVCLSGAKPRRVSSNPGVWPGSVGELFMTGDEVRYADNMLIYLQANR